MSRGRPDAEPIDAHAWMDLLVAQHTLRRRWAAPVRGLRRRARPAVRHAAFPHDAGRLSKRRLDHQRPRHPYGAQTGWPGVATYPGLPATVAPLGKTAAACPSASRSSAPSWKT